MKVLLGLGEELIYQNKSYEIIDKLNDGSFNLRTLDESKDIIRMNKMEILEKLEKNEMLLPQYQDKIIPLSNGMHGYILEDFSRVSKKKQEEALLKEKIIKPLYESNYTVEGVKKYIEELKENPDILAEMKVTGLSFQISTIYRWLSDYRKGNGHIMSLVSKKRGNYPREYFGTIAQRTIKKYVHMLVWSHDIVDITLCYDYIKRDLEDWNKKYPNDKETIPCKKTIERRVEAERNNKAAVKGNSKLAKNLKENEKPSYAMQVAQADHTRLDIFVINEETGQAIRPWLTYIMDVYSAYPLGVYIGFEPPSYKSVMYALKNAFYSKKYVKDNYEGIEKEWKAHGIPEKLRVDNGEEFHSKHLEDVCKHVNMELEFTPPGRPWYKGAIERFFRTLNERFLHKTVGTTLSNSEQLKKAGYNPRKHAIITFSQFVELFHQWMIDIFSETWHRGVKGKPRALWEESTQNGYLVPIGKFGPQWEILLYPIEKRKIQNYGIELSRLRFNSVELGKIARYLKEKNGDTTVQLKINPDDISKVFVYDEFFTKSYIEVPCTNRKYSEGLPLITHRQILSDIREKSEPADEQHLNRARIAFFEKIEKMKKSNKARDATKVARYTGVGSNHLGQKDAKNEKKIEQKVKFIDLNENVNIGWD